MPSQAVIIGGSEFQQDNAPLKSYDSFGVSAAEYYKTLNALEPFQGNCTLIPADGEHVDEDAVQDAISTAASRAKGADETLLLVYVGHGKAWADHHDNVLHLAMYKSREDRPAGWLEYSAIRRATSAKKDGLRIVIADCCYSNVLHSQGAGLDNVPEGIFALMERDQGVAVFTALAPNGSNVNASPEGCVQVDEEWRGCTHFSSHLLQVLNKGSRYAENVLSLGDVRDEIRESMRNCPPKLQSGLILQGPADSTPFVQNRLSPGALRDLPDWASEEKWVAGLKTGRQWPIETLLADERMAARVSLALWRIPEGRQNAHRIDSRAIETYTNDMDKYCAYWHIRDEVDGSHH